MKRPSLRTYVLFGVPIVLLALAAATYLAPRPRAVTVAALYERLAVGMTEAEVTAAIPLPPGDHTRSFAHVTSAPTCEGGLPVFVDYHPWPDGTVTAPHPSGGPPLRGRWWLGEDGLVLVFFGENDRVIERRHYPGSPLSRVNYHWDRLVR